LRRTQDHLALAAGALGKVISGVISGDTEIDKLALLADLCDTSRYIIGTQYSLSSFRRKQVQNQFKDHSMSQILSATELYPKLFGSDLSAEAKAAKALDKVGLEMAIKPSTTKTNRLQQASSSRQGKPS